MLEKIESQSQEQLLPDDEIRAIIAKHLKSGTKESRLKQQVIPTDLENYSVEELEELMVQAAGDMGARSEFAAGTALAEELLTHGFATMRQGRALAMELSGDEEFFNGLESTYGTQLYIEVSKILDQILAEVYVDGPEYMDQITQAQAVQTALQRLRELGGDLAIAKACQIVAAQRKELKLFLQLLQRELHIEAEPT